MVRQNNACLVQATIDLTSRRLVMANSKTGGSGEKTTDIEDILIERHRLEQVLKNYYSKEVTILFSDICGYTRYVDDRGDISGRTMLVKHNQIVLPIIDAHNGKVVEIIGDAVMSCFDDPLDAVMAAADIQQRLAAYNLKAADGPRHPCQDRYSSRRDH